MVGERFPNINHFPKIKAPVLLIHGTSDRVIHHSHSQRLYEAATQSTERMLKLCAGMGHNSYNMQWDIVANMEEFLEKIEFIRYKNDQVIEPKLFTTLSQGEC